MVNLVSPRFVGQFDGVLLIAGLIPLMLVVTVGWFVVRRRAVPRVVERQRPPLYQALPNSLALVFWAFTGLESASVAAAVVDKPERNVPIATLAGVLIAAVIYMAASIVDLRPRARRRHRGVQRAVRARRPRKMLGPTAGPLVALCGGLKALGTLAGWVLMTAQVSRAAADHGLLPQFSRARARAIRPWPD